MNEFFTFTTNLSPYTKWVLIRLITGRVIGDELSKADFIEFGCTHNKLVRVIEELQKINAISKLEFESFKRGRPALSYSFIYNCPNKIDKLIPSEMLAKLEGLKLRVPIKLVWSFFALNQDEQGYIEGFSVAKIAKACGLKVIEVKTAIEALKEKKIIFQVIRGCTLKAPVITKNNTIISTFRNKNLKRASCFRIMSDTQQKFLYLVITPPLTTPYSLSRSKNRNSFTAILLDFLSKENVKEKPLLNLLRFETKESNITTDYCLYELQFLTQQPSHIFDYFDQILFKLVSQGLSHLLNHGTNIKPICEEDTFNLILSPANYEFATNLAGLISSYLITHLANILIHYILYAFYSHREKSDDLEDVDQAKYLTWIHSLNSSRDKVDIQIIKTQIVVTLQDSRTIENFVLSTNLDLSAKVKILKGYSEFKEPRSLLKDGEYSIFQCVYSLFAHFYKTVITSERL
ncbi:hypothetical protein [Pseudoalteromonas sp. 1181_04]|uniref:hypothetical protein n=1 Tax=Pseudoalteromonas sp. 1181_04 TaxID=2604450 RepID=UPI0040636BDC